MLHTTATWRAAAASDVETLLALMRELYATDNHPFDPRSAGRALGELLARPSSGRIWLMTAGEAIAGYVVLTFGFSLEFGGRDAFIDELYVRPRFAGRGLGAATLAFVEQEMRAAGVRALHLEVRLENRRALELYERAGFTRRESRLMSKKIGL